MVRYIILCFHAIIPYFSLFFLFILYHFSHFFSYSLNRISSSYILLFCSFLFPYSFTLYPSSHLIDTIHALSSPLPISFILLTSSLYSYVTHIILSHTLSLYLLILLLYLHLISYSFSILSTTLIVIFSLNSYSFLITSHYLCIPSHRGQHTLALPVYNHPNLVPSLNPLPIISTFSMKIP